MPGGYQDFGALDNNTCPEKEIDRTKIAKCVMFFILTVFFDDEK